MNQSSEEDLDSILPLIPLLDKPVLEEVAVLLFTKITALAYGQDNHPAAPQKIFKDANKQELIVLVQSCLTDLRTMQKIKSTLDKIRENLPEILGPETSSDPRFFSKEHPAAMLWGQCAVLALLVQDECGGTVQRCYARLPSDDAIKIWLASLPDIFDKVAWFATLPADRRVSHYRNIVCLQISKAPHIIDVSALQFPPSTIYEERALPEGYNMARTYLLSPHAAETGARYALLRSRLGLGPVKSDMVAPTGLSRRGAGYEPS